MNDFKQSFENSFSTIESFGFSTPVKFTGTEVGVSIMKDFSDETASLMKFIILHPSGNNIEPLHISITHGRKNSDSIVIRDTVKLTNPIDLFSLKNTGERFFSIRSLYLKDRYYYDKTLESFLKNNQEITASDLVQEVFEKHIRSTKPVLGLLVRMQLWFWNVALPALFYTFFYNFLHYFLFLISGDRYTYNMFKGKGEINKKPRPDDITKWESESSERRQLEPKEEEGEKMDVFGYKLSQHAAVIYSILNLGFYFYFYFHDGQLPKVLEIVSGNTLVALFYVIVTLHFFDKWLPSILKFCIDGMVKIAYYFTAKPIGI